MEEYATYGAHHFIESHGGPQGDPYCNHMQLTYTVSFLYTVWAQAFANTPAYAIVMEYEETSDGFLVWQEFLRCFMDQGI